MPRDDRVDVHLAQGDGAVLDFLQRDSFKAVNQRRRVGASMRLDQPDDDVDALAPHEVRVLEHAIGLADTRSGAQINTKPARLRRVVRGALSRGCSCVGFQREGPAVGLSSDLHGVAIRLSNSDGKREAKGGARAETALHRDLSALGFDQAPHQGQAQTGGSAVRDRR